MRRCPELPICNGAGAAPIILCGGLDMRMAQQLLHGHQIDVVIKEITSNRASDIMRRGA